MDSNTQEQTNFKRWDELLNDRVNLAENWKKYAEFTLGYIDKENAVNNINDVVVYKSSLDIGAALVTNLANKIATAGFPADKPFFQLRVDESGFSEEELAALDSQRAEFSAALRAAENKAYEKLNITTYRATAIEVIESLIITGNSCIYRKPNGVRKVYNPHMYALERDEDGFVIELLLLDYKSVKSLTKKERDYLASKGKILQNPVNTDIKPQKLKLISRFVWDVDSKKYAYVQSLDTVQLDYTEKTFTKDNMPALVLAWDISSGEHYGRGLVERHEQLFDAGNTCSISVNELTRQAAKNINLVNPGAVTDIEEFNKAPNGSYMLGSKDDISQSSFGGYQALQVVTALLAEYKNELRKTFLMSGMVQRDAERVTAEEVRQVANEIQQSFGGMYARLAEQWQKAEALWLFKEIKIDLSTMLDVNVVITTGLETLTREGQITSLNRALQNLTIVSQIPEQLLNVISPEKLLTKVCDLYGVNAKEFTYSQEEVQQMQQQMQQQQDQMMAQQAAMAAQKAG